MCWPCLHQMDVKNTKPKEAHLVEDGFTNIMTLLWWVGVKYFFTGVFFGPKKVYLLDNGEEHMNKYDDCTLHNVSYFGQLG